MSPRQRRALPKCMASDGPARPLPTGAHTPPPGNWPSPASRPKPTPGRECNPSKALCARWPALFSRPAGGGGGALAQGLGGWAWGGGGGTRPRWLALLACGGAYWPLALEPSAMPSRHLYCRGHPPVPGGESRMQLLPMASSPDGLISARHAVITKTRGWGVLTTTRNVNVSQGHGC